MKEIERAYKNDRIISKIKQYSQIRYGSRYGNRYNINYNNGLADDIKDQLTEYLYFRKVDRIVYFYNHWVVSKYYNYTEELKE